MKSIMQNKKACYVCGSQYCLENHHTIYGTANRKLADKYGLTVWLCMYHHRGDEGVHGGNTRLDAYLKRDAQEAFEKTYPELSFRQIFGKNYKE